jgi:hypothetical protein
MKTTKLNCPICDNKFDKQDFIGIHLAPAFKITCRKCYTDSPINIIYCILGYGLFFSITFTVTFYAVELGSKFSNHNKFIFLFFLVGIVLGGYVGFNVYVKYIISIIRQKGWANKKIKPDE